MIPRMSIPGNACTRCGTTIGKELVCSGCGWVDPPTKRQESMHRNALDEIDRLSGLLAVRDAELEQANYEIAQLRRRLHREEER